MRVSRPHSQKEVSLFIIVFGKNVRKNLDNTEDQVKKRTKILLDSLLKYSLHIIFLSKSHYVVLFNGFLF